LKDEDKEVQTNAAIVLGRIGPAAKEAIPALEAAARDGVDGAEAALKMIRGKQ
jgi:HEAT repeat protein